MGREKSSAVRTPAKGRPPRALNAAHLRRQTLGDAALAAELLDLFALQARQALAALEAGLGPAECGALAHALLGAARAVGARQVARTAAAAETAATDPARLPWAVAELKTAVRAAIAAIPHATAG